MNRSAGNRAPRLGPSAYALGEQPTPFLPFTPSVAQRSRGALLLSLLAASPALAGERFSLGENLANSDVVLEVKVPLKKGAADWKAATLEKVVSPAHATEPAAVPAKTRLFSSGSPCWKKAKGGAVKALVFFKATGADGGYTQVGGVEAETGRYSELHPAYAKLVEAAAAGGAFADERMRAVGPETLWQKERAALAQKDNPYLRAAAAAFLAKHGAADVVDLVWGKPGSPERKAAEALAQEPGPENVCRKP